MPKLVILRLLEYCEGGVILPLLAVPDGLECMERLSLSTIAPSSMSSSDIVLKRI